MLLVLLACRSEDSGSFWLATDVIVSRHPDIATVLDVTWQQHAEGEAWLSWVVEGQPQRSPPRPRAPGPARELVLGVPSETEVEELALHVLSDGQERRWELGSISTGPLPADLPEGTLTAMEEAEMRPESYLLTSLDVGDMPFYGPWYTLILDRQGRIVWYLLSPERLLTWQPRVARSGDALLVETLFAYTLGEETPPTVTRLGLDQVHQQTIALPGLLHAYEELPDGSWLYDERVDDFEYYLARQDASGATERLWACNPWMDAFDRRPDNCATNTVVWSPERGTVLWSSYRRSIVVEIDLETGEQLREFGDYPEAYRFDPPEAGFELQHYPHWTAEGTLLLSAHDPVTGEQVAREYEVDDATETLRLRWSAKSEHHANYAGQITTLPSGNLLWELGTAGVIQEITREGRVVWEVQWPGTVVGNVTPLQDLYALATGT
jgi:hypothetical protein